MTVRHATPARHAPRRTAAAVAGLLALSAAAAGCSASSGAVKSHGQVSSAAPSPSAPPTPAAVITSNLPDGKHTVPVNRIVKLDAQKGSFTTVKVSTAKGGTISGHLSDGKKTWTATERLEPGVRYDVRAVAVDDNGLRTVEKDSFKTDDLTLDEQTYPAIAPLQGETVGVGMPVIVKFDVPVTRHAAIERHLSVDTSPHQVGAWHWISDNEVHWRPKHFWKPGTHVTVHADINSIKAGHDVWGQLSRSQSFTVGDSVIDKVNVKKHEMKVYINGALARTVPISAGKPGFITRSGTKVIISKDRSVIMDAASVGIPKSSPEYYKLKVDYAMRVTYSGEFLHAAPWSAGAQGIANTSHGCVGMSMEDAAWLFNLTKRGDVVEVTGSDRHMTLTNGWGDWNESFKEYKQGSALH